MSNLSIVLPTCNRAESLVTTLDCLRPDVRECDELIVVDGASTDGTADVLATAAEAWGGRLKVIREAKREGFVRAANKGFAAATSDALCWLNDDARPLPGALRSAVAQLDASPPHVGLLAMYHATHAARNVACERRIGHRVYRLLHVRGTLYANFGLGRRATFARLGYFDDRYFLNAADPDFSLKVWHAGLTVEPAHGAMIEHDETADDRRDEDATRGRLDNERLFAKWDLPPKNAMRNDFDPRRPCTLRGMTAAAMAA